MEKIFFVQELRGTNYRISEIFGQKAKFKGQVSRVMGGVRRHPIPILY